MSFGLNTRFAPSFRLIQAHFALGIAGLLAFSAALMSRATEVQGFFFQPLLLGLVHLCVLGWLMPIAIGALHQLVPVVFEVQVRSERLSWIAFGLYVIGVPVFIEQMWTLRAGLLLPVAATCAASAIWLYAANLMATLARSKVRSLTGLYVITALIYLVIAVAVGAMLAWNLYSPYLPIVHIAVLRAHAHAAGFGFFGLLVMGVSYRLIEMFLLSHGAPERAGKVAYVAVNLAIVSLVASFLDDSQRWLLAAGVVLAAIGVAAFILQVRAIFQRRMQRHVDIAWRHTATAFFYLAASVAIGGTLALAPINGPMWDRLHLAYGLLALPGFLGTIVVGQLYKILPFLVWLHRFAAYVGMKKIPAASELLPEGPKRLQYLFMHVGIAALAAGVLLDLGALRLTGATSFAISAALVARNLGVIWTSRP